jgi:hypothetical protein
MSESTADRSVASAGLTGSQDLFIPYVDVTLPSESVTGLSVAGEFSGTAQESLRSSLDVAELNIFRRLFATTAWRIDALGGFRYFGLGERYGFATTSTRVPPAIPDIFNTQDSFEANNEFFGAQLGVAVAYDLDRWFAEGNVRLAIGAIQQSVQIDGRLVTNDFNDFGAPQTFLGGYFAQATNIGHHVRDEVAVVPEINFSLGYRVTPWAALMLGYTFFYVSDIVRPGNHIDRNINPSQSSSFTGVVPTSLEGAAKPGFQFHGTDFWAQSFNVGLNIQF